MPTSFLTTPIAHRALHDRALGRPENSLSAVQAAVDARYGIEIDLQLTRDHKALVFHDYALQRLTYASGPVRQRTATEMATLPLRGSEDAAPLLSELLELVGGKVPLLIELKDQDGALGPDVGVLEQATVDALTGYQGDVALMSFNPHSVAALADLAPDLPRGLVTEDFIAVSDEWPVPIKRLEELRHIPDYDRVGASFISHNRNHLSDARVLELKAQGANVLCWTVRSLEEENAARQVAENVTFEGYLAPFPA